MPESVLDFSLSLFGFVMLLEKFVKNGKQISTDVLHAVVLLP